MKGRFTEQNSELPCICRGVPQQEAVSFCQGARTRLHRPVRCLPPLVPCAHLLSVMCLCAQTGICPPYAALQCSLCQLRDLCYRIDAPIYFANVEWIRGRIDKYRMRANRDPALGPVFFVILDMSPVPFVDSTGEPPQPCSIASIYTCTHIPCRAPKFTFCF